jgi:dehydratase family protein/DDE superfamily endonuclease
VVLAQDETDVLLFPPLRAGWARRGEVAEVRLSGWNARQVVFGATNLSTGHRLFLARERQRARDFQAFLEVLHHHYRAWQVALLLDEDPSHTAKSVVGHVAPEAAAGGTIALVQEGDPITIDAEARRLQLDVPEEELARRRAVWQPPVPRYTRGVLAKYARLVSSSSRGAVTDTWLADRDGEAIVP